MKQFKLVTMDALTAYERGVQYGEQARAEIGLAVAYYKAKFESNQSWQNVLNYSLRYIPMIESYAPECLEEVQGISEGSGYSLAEIMTVNCRYEISQFKKIPECTTAAVLSPVTTGEKNYLIKNCDLYEGVIPHLVLLHIIKPNGYRGFGLTEAGQLVRDGYNNFGVALVNNALCSNLDYQGVSVPGTFVRKKIWDSESFESACEIQRQAERTVSTNMIIGHKSGKAINFESFPGGVDEIVPSGGILTHANHFVVNPELNRLTDEPRNRDTQLCKILEANAPDITETLIMEALRDHKYYPLSICRHADGVDTCTVSSMIINMTDDIIYICVGNPCKEEYMRYHM